MKKVTLYIGTHNDTGLKYFGKTNRYHTKEELQKYYHGSGSDWKEHLKEFGDNVNMDIYGIYSMSEVKEIALKFSLDNNIVESDIWANNILEDGLGSVLFHSDKTKKKISTNTKKGMTIEVRNKLSLLKKDTVAVVDASGSKFRVSKEEYDNNPNLFGHTKDKITVRNKKTNETLSIDAKDFDRVIYQGVAKGYKATGKAKANHKKAGKKRTGLNNGSAKLIHILNGDKLIFICEGNISKIAKDNNLPINLLRGTLKTKIPIKSKKYSEFNGWIAKEII